MEDQHRMRGLDDCPTHRTIDETAIMKSESFSKLPDSNEERIITSYRSEVNNESINIT